MAVVADYRFDDLKATVRIHDDLMVEKEKRQEIYDRAFAYVENACIRAALAREGKEVSLGG